MPVNVSKTYTNYKRPETTNFFLGNSAEWQKVDLFCAVVVGFFGDTVNTVTLVSNSRIKANDGISWFNRGFDVGDTVILDVLFSIAGGAGSLTGTVVVSDIDNDEMSFSGSPFALLNGFMSLPGYGSTTTGDIMQCTKFNLLVDKKPEGLDLEAGHPENSDAVGGNTASVIDGSTVKQRALGINGLSPGGTLSMFPIGEQSGMAIHSASITYITSILSIHFYRVSITYMMCGIFDDSSNYDDLNNIIRPDYFAGTQCLTDVYRLKFKYIINNPNIYTINEPEVNPPLGNTGGFNENFNDGFADEIVCESTVYKNTLGNIVPKLDYWNPTDVTCTINGISNLSNLNTKFTFGFFWLPKTDEDYKNNDRPFHHNVFANTGGADPTDVYTVGAPIPGTLNGWGYNLMAMDFTNCSANIVAGKLELKFRVNPSPNMKQFFHSKTEDNRNYLLYINTANYAQTTNTSNAVTHILDSGTMLKSPFMVGGYPALTANFLEHDIAVDAFGLNYIDGFLEDDALWRIDVAKLFAINYFYPGGVTFTISNFTFKKFTYAVEARNVFDGRIVNLESLPIDTSVYPFDMSGNHLINYVASRNFKYVAGNYRNRVSLEHNPVFGWPWYIGYYGLKIRWEDWIARPGIPADFIDGLELQNGQNNDWLQKIQNVNWQLFVSFYIDVVDGNGDEYQFRNPYEITKINDYDSNAMIAKSWLYKRFSDNTILNLGTDPDTGKTLGVILEDEYTSVECDFTILDATTWPTLFEESYGTMNLQVWRGSGEIEHRQLSTMTLSEPDNPLKPLPGEQYLNWEIVAPNVLRLKCLIDPSLLQNAVKFQITARVESIPRLKTGKTMEDDTQKEMEDGTHKILD